MHSLGIYRGTEGQQREYARKRAGWDGKILAGPAAAADGPMTTSEISPAFAYEKIRRNIAPRVAPILSGFPVGSTPKSGSNPFLCRRIHLSISSSFRRNPITYSSKE